MAASGTTMASFSVRTASFTVTKAPGHSCSSLLSNTAFTFTVPDAASTALSTKASLPLRVPRPSGSTATTLPPPPRSERSASCRSRCGRLKVTAIGSSWVIVTSGAALGCTSVPGNTLTVPARPELGATMRE